MIRLLGYVGIVTVRMERSGSQRSMGEKKKENAKPPVSRSQAPADCINRKPVILSDVVQAFIAMYFLQTRNTNTMLSNSQPYAVPTPPFSKL